LGAGDDRRHDVARKSADALKKVCNLFVFQFELDRIVNVLVLAAATFAEVTALGFDALRRWRYDTDELRAGEGLFNFGELGFNFLAGRHERDEHDELPDASDPFAAEGDVSDGQGDALAG
jgi:hypothetical protein